ncbi:GNAT family N-acetyltransferase [Actinoplanes sp. LDG1-01]|uniref:GNAT family N-acetyltransferase n=1 Tax=Paractinoplanes lichenicola TaxID=2802976 RepID=A0ABS1VT60_9ACTN|nr:GNAT family N-acetyltransferase [Actinoplanes lichenicola]
MSEWLAAPENSGVWRMRLEQARNDPGSEAWTTGIVWDPVRGKAVGRAGFHAPPDAEGMVEIGYAIDPEFRRQGYARAALESLLARAKADPSVRRIRVSISPDNLASRNLALPYGFEQVGEQWDEEDGLEIVYELACP